MNFLRQTLTLTGKDLLAEFRSRESITTMLMFSVLVVIIFNFTFETGSTVLREAAPGVIWIAITFSSVIGLNRSFVYEVDKGCLQGLLLTPVDRGVIFVGKMLSNLTFIFMVELVTLPLFAVFFNLSIFESPLQLMVVVLLADLGLASVGTLFSAIAVNTRTRDIMLPLLLLPVFVPVLLAAVKGTALILHGTEWSALAGWLRILTAFDVIFLSACFILFDYVVED